MTRLTLVRTRTSTVPPSQLTRIQSAITPVRAGIARTPKVTSALEADPRYILPKQRGANNERAKGALYFYNNFTKAGRRKSVWVWASMVTLALFPKFPQKAITHKLFKSAAGVWKAYSDAWVKLGLVAAPSVKKDVGRRVFIATVPLGAFPRMGYPAGMARFAVATYGPEAPSQDFWTETVTPHIDASMVPGKYDLNGATAVGSTNVRDLENFKAANGRIIIKEMGGDNLAAFLQLEFTQRESEFLCNAPWLEIRPLDFYGVIRAWVDGIYGGRAKSPSFSIPIGRIAKQSDAKNAPPRLSADGLSLDEHGSIVALPDKLNDIHGFEDKAATAFSQADGSYSAVGEDGRNKKPPPAMPVYIDWVNLKFSYTTLEGKLVIKNLDRSQPVNITHIRNFLEKKVSDDTVLNFISFSVRLGGFFGLPEVQSIVSQERLLWALSKEIERHGEYRTVEEAPVISIQDYAREDDAGEGGTDNSEVLLMFCRMVKKLKKFIDENPTNAYAEYSVPTIIELQGLLTVFSIYAPKFGEVKALDNTRREPYEKQGVDPNWKLEPIPFVLPERGLMPHQADVENKLRGCPDNATIPVAAGGGKTIIIAYEILRMMKAGGQDMFLIMCPSHLVSQYVKEFVYAAGSQVNVIPVTTYTIRRHGLARLGQMILNSPINTVVVADYNAITYRQSTIAYGATPVKLYPIIEFLRQYPFKYVACDEAHYLKNGSSRNAAAGRIIIEIQKKRLASGTMVANTMIDLVRQISLMDPSVFGTVNDFTKEYAMKVAGSKVTEWKKGAELAVQRLIRRNVVEAGAKRKEWAAILPFPLEEFHVVDFSENQLKCYQDILAREEKSLRDAALHDENLRKLLDGEISSDDPDADEDGGTMNIDNLLRAFSTVIERFMAAPGLDPLGKLVLKGPDLVSPKVIKAVNICREHIANGNTGKILIFTNYEDSAIAVYDAFPPDMKDKVIYYTASNKDACVAEFDNNPKKLIMCGIEASMNTGLNLQAASRLIRVETVWTPGSLEQGNSRIGRPNVKETELRPNVYYDWLVTNYTIDVSKASCLMAKTISKAKFDEAGNPVFDKLEVPPLFKLNLANVLAMNDANNTLVDYFVKYETYKQALRKEFADYKAANHDRLFVTGPDGKDRLKMAPLEKAAAPDGSAVMLTLPYVPGIELFKSETLGLQRYDSYMRLNTAELEAENEAAESKSGGDDDDSDDDEAEDEEKDDASSADAERKAKLAAESESAVGLQVHTEFGNGEIIRINRRFVKVRQPSGGVFWVNKLAAFVITKPAAAGKDLRTQLVNLNGGLPVEVTLSLVDPVVVKMRPLKVKKRRGQEEDVEDAVEVEQEEVVEDAAVEMVLDFTVVNDYLGVRLVNTDNEAAVRVAQGMGFKHPPQYFAAKMIRATKVLELFKGWNAAGFEVDVENSRACEAAFNHWFANRKSAANFYGVANDNSIRNFYKMEFKPDPLKTHINPYPLIQDNELYIALPKNGHPGSVRAIQKVRLPALHWFVYGGNEELIAFTPRKEKASVLIKSLLDQGVVIPNIKDLIKKFRTLRIARDSKKGADFAE